jgi:hypothetical protein
MARLIYSAIMSLDGYTADADRRFERALNLTLAQEHRFSRGTVYPCYRPEGGADPC